MKKLEEGMIVRHNDSPDESDYYWVSEGGRRLRTLTDPRSAVNCSSNEVLVGRLPPNELDATEWNNKYKLPEAYDPKEHDLFWSGYSWQYAATEWLDNEGNERDRKELVRKADKVSDKGEDAVQPSVQKLLLECQSRWASQLQDFCQKHATGDIGRDVCDVTLELANKWRKQLAQERAARETAEKAAMHVDESEKERAERVERDFRAATGQEYEPGRDYERAFIKMSEYDRCFAALQVAREETKVAWRQYDKVSIPPKEPAPCPSSLRP